MSTSERILSAIIVFLLFSITTILCNEKSKSKSVSVFSPIKTINAKGQETTITGVVSVDYKTIHESDLKEIARLKSIIKKNTLVAMTHDVQTNDTGETKTIVIRDSSDTCNPKYYTYWSDSLSTGSILATKDTIYRGIKTINKFDVTINMKYSFFRKDTLYATVLNLNPKTITLDFKVYQKATKNPNRIRWFVSGTIVGVIVAQGLKLLIQK
jgi:hypothetical protein